MPFRRLFGLSVFALLLLSSPVLAQTVSFIDENGGSASSYLEFTRAYVRVEDPAANTSSGSPDTVSVTLSAALSGDSEVLSLTETGPGTGVFEGGMYIARSPAVPADGYLETWIQAGPPVVRETLTVQYSPSITDTAVLVGARIQLLDEYGRPAAGYTEGDWVTVRVVDYVSYNDLYTRDGVTVAVNVLAVSDEEFIVLQETGEYTSVYEGRIPAALYATYDNDGIVGAPAGNLVHAQYALSDAQETVDVEVPLVGSRAEILDNEGEPAGFVAESSTIRLRAVDRTVGGPGLVDTVQAEASSEIGLDEETVTLTETGVSTGVFEADLPTSIDSTLPSNGVLETAENAGPPHRFDTITL
ncbi:MAG TPA: hypothetical protein VFR31_11185, partial [Thermoanaerobaculia bacterium]|nr:hypothetical protein [Thermoanaerobaculia bacterium]